VKRSAIVGLVLGAFAVSAWGLPEPGFYASYDQGLDADAAAGNPAAEVRQAYLRLALPTTEAWSEPDIAVPHLEIAPTTDGELSDPAWEWAAGVSGFVDRATGRVPVDQPTVMMLVVNDTLHLAGDAPLRDGQAPTLHALMGDWTGGPPFPPGRLLLS